MLYIHHSQGATVMSTPYSHSDDLTTPRKLRELKPDSFNALVDCDSKVFEADARVSEIADTLFVAVALRAGGRWAHSATAMKAPEERPLVALRHGSRYPSYDA
jgi:hypothetical protein